MARRRDRWRRDHEAARRAGWAAQLEHGPAGRRHRGPLRARYRHERGPVTAAPPTPTLYGKVLFLRRTRLRWWVRSIYLEGAVGVGFVLYLANVASAWVMVVLPASIAVMVKVYDLVLSATVELPPR